MVLRRVFVTEHSSSCLQFTHRESVSRHVTFRGDYTINGTRSFVRSYLGSVYTVYFGASKQLKVPSYLATNLLTITNLYGSVKRRVKQQTTYSKMIKDPIHPTPFPDSIDDGEYNTP